MATSAHNTYLEERIHSADPIELVRILYKAAIEALASARRHLAAGGIPQRSAVISRAVEILAELHGSLDHERAPEMSRRLAELYDYMQRRLIEANFQQADQPLAEVLKLLETLAEAWNAMPVSPTVVRQPAPAAREWNPFAVEAEPEPALHGWSF
jgi:flagellar secretion chaperone FliS